MKNKSKRLIKFVFIASMFFVILGIFLVVNHNNKNLYCSISKKLSRIDLISKAIGKISTCTTGYTEVCGNCVPLGSTQCTCGVNVCVSCASGWTCTCPPNGQPTCVAPTYGGGTSTGGTTGTSTSSNCSNCWFNISANPSTIASGQCTTITWNSGPLGNWVLGSSQNIWTGSISGSQQKCPTATTVYGLGIMCKDSCGERTNSTTVTVKPTATTPQPPSVTTPPSSGSPSSSSDASELQSPPKITLFSANPTLINQGNSSTLSWKTVNANAAKITSKTASGTVTKTFICSGASKCASGSLVVAPTETTTYTLSAENSVTSVESTISITVSAPNPPAVSQPAPTVSTPPATTCNTNAIPRCPGYYCSNGKWICPSPIESPATTTQPKTTQPAATGSISAPSSTSTSTTPSTSTATSPTIIYYNGVCGTAGTQCSTGLTCTKNSSGESKCLDQPAATTTSAGAIPTTLPTIVYYNGICGTTETQCSSGLTCTATSSGESRCLDTQTQVPNPITTESSSTQKSAETQCNLQDIEGIFKFDQIKNQYFITKNDNTFIYLSIDPNTITNLTNYLNHKVKATGCLSNDILAVSKITITDNPEGNQAGSVAAASSTSSITKLVSTGGVLWFNILAALFASGIIGYFILKPGKRVDY